MERGANNDPNFTVVVVVHQELESSELRDLTCLLVVCLVFLLLLVGANDVISST